MEKWTRVLYQPNLPLKKSGHVTAGEEHIRLAEEAAAEGMVLLKNDNDLLPLKSGSRIALFGKGSFDYVKGGGGSGDVTVAYTHNLYDGLKLLGGVEIFEPLAEFYRQDVAAQYREGAAPGMTVEPELPEALLRQARAFGDTAVIVLSRFSGEGWDRSDVVYNEDLNPWEEVLQLAKRCGEIFPEGDFYLSGGEKKLVSRVKAAYQKVAVVLNIGGVIDVSWIRDDPGISSALIAWQGGMEGGLAAAQLLCGRRTPAGKLTDTFARELTDYPSTANFHESPHYVDYTDDIYVGYRYFETMPGAAEKVVYPFGFGLSYTDFDIETQKVWAEDAAVRARVLVTNTGGREGRETVQLYYGAPQGVLKKPARELGAFAKTRLLLPGESQTVILSFSAADMASYDDLGKIAKSAYVLEKGDYHFYIGNSVRDAAETEFVLTIREDTVTRQLSPKLVPTALKKRMLSDGSFEELPQGTPHDPNECAFEKMIPGTDSSLSPAVEAQEQFRLADTIKPGAKPLLSVAQGEITMEEFLAQLEDDELIHLVGGQPNTGVANTFGMGNLPRYGVPNIMTADGPAGLRIQPQCGVCTTAFPCATLLACTWDPALVMRVGAAGAEEVKENNIAMWLTPAVNIHRNPMCGRNFEYYSEDPLIAGKMGAAMVQGIQSQHISACVKHFAVNNKETNRVHCDSRVSERALREIYLRAFEIIVKEADPWAIMTSYNCCNGWRTSESHELLEDILRGEWGYQGMVTTDWWSHAEHYKEILAGNDIKMGCGFPKRVRKALDMGLVTRDDLARCAGRVLELILKID